MKIKRFLLGCVITSALLGSSTGYSQLVIQHLGAADPETEGWVLVEPGNGVLSPVIDDQGRDAWSIAVSGGNEYGIYQYFLSPLEQERAKSEGWVLSTRVRLVDAPDVSYSIVRVATGGTGNITVPLTMDANGDPVAEFQGSHTILNGGGDYHEFALAYDPIEAMVTFWINGVHQGSFPRSADAAPPARIDFGAGQTSGLTHAHWNEVTFTIVPEPATVALLAGLGVLLVAGGVRWRKRGLNQS